LTQLKSNRALADARASAMNTWIKFNVVGLLGFVLQTAALFLLTRTAPGVGYLAATALAVELAVLNNFVWHQRWTWIDRPSLSKIETWHRLARFNATSGMVSLVGNLALMRLFVGRLGLPVVSANVVTAAACSLLSFCLADRIAFPFQAEARL
jgi:dolichol-phosphate mannosyltransferase